MIGESHNVTVETKEITTVIVDKMITEEEEDDNRTDSVLTSIPECSLVSDLPNAWLQVKGNGNIYTVSTCNANTEAVAMLTILEGPVCGGDELICSPIYEYDEELSLLENCGQSSFASQISWITTPGSLYRILVSTIEAETRIGIYLTEQQLIAPLTERDNSNLQHYVNHRQNNNNTSSFSSLSGGGGGTSTLKSKTKQKTHETTPSNPSSSLPPSETKNKTAVEATSSGGSPIAVSNDDYENATAIDIDGQILIGGSTVYATLENRDKVGHFCGTSIVAPGVWYVVTGEGNGIQVSTCSEFTTYDTSISVFTVLDEDEDEVLHCIGGGNNDVLCGYDPKATTVSFFGDVGVLYYILIHGGNTDQVGSFGLSVTSFIPVDNDTCESAISLPFGALQTGSTLLATIDETPNNAFFCGAFVGVRSGVWYQVVGTGESFAVTSCTSATNYNTAISVFVGNCDGGFGHGKDGIGEDQALTCIGGNDDDFSCNPSEVFGRSTYQWQTVPEQLYYILVHGSYFSDSIELFTSGYGDFGILLTAS